ncbi:flagellar hook-length control protein FliK [Oxalobacteraceae bacterium]|nr:flagellar hook-length control protein FliK [Oxalobacteraceae bacterium]
MLPRLDASVAPVKPADSATPVQPAGEPRQAAFQRSLQSLVGQSMAAQVLSQYSDGSFLVKVAGNQARMLLPPGVQVGTEVPLTLIAANPRPVFQFGSGGAQGAPAPLVYPEALPGAAPADAEAATLPSQNPAAGQTGMAKPAPGNATLPGSAPPLPAGVKGEANPAASAPPSQTQPGAAKATLPAAGQGTVLPGQLQADTPDGPAPSQTQAQTQTQTRPLSLAATLLGRAPLTPANELPPLDAKTLPATLSPMARALTTMLSTAQAPAGAPVILSGKTPLTGKAAPDTATLATTLRDTLSQSGLFYESHVTEWVKGERSLTDLMREPQMQRLMQGADAAARAATAGPDLAAAQMVNQQLHAHEQARVQWHGEAWPGQPMQWEVRRDDSEGGKQQGKDGEPDAGQVWRSGVRFRFAALGQVSATVTLVGDQVHIQVQADSENAAGTLRSYAGTLEQAMEAAGAPLSSLTIKAGDGT